MSDVTSIAVALRARLAGAPRVGIVGLGYVGLPLAVAFAESGATVIGVDLDAARVASIAAGRSFIEDVPTETLAPLVRAERLAASERFEALKDADAVVICVPTPLGKSKEPDISFIVGAADAVARVARRGQLIVLESTTYPGTTQEVLVPRFEARGLEAGRDVFLAFSPERIDPGNREHTLRTIPKVVGGLTPACTELAAALYARITPQMVTDALNDRERAVRGARILALGVAYKANVADTRDSPALEIIDALAARGARVDYHDPHVPAVAVSGVKLESVPWPADLGARDVVLVLTPHAEYDWAAVVAGARLVIDTRNATAGIAPVPNVIRL